MTEEEKRHLDRLERIAEKAKWAMKDKGILDLGTSRGWKLSRTAIGLDELSRNGGHSWSDVKHNYNSSGHPSIMDHECYYRLNRRAVAIFTQPYLEWCSHDEKLNIIQTVADTYNLDFEILPEEPFHHSPGRTTAILLKTRISDHEMDR